MGRSFTTAIATVLACYALNQAFFPPEQTRSSATGDAVPVGRTSKPEMTTDAGEVEVGPEFVSFSVSSGATVLISSLDLTAQLHQIDFAVEPISPNNDLLLTGDGLSADQQIVRVAHNDVSPAVGIPCTETRGSSPVSGFVTQELDEVGTDLPVAGILRRFRVPLFTSELTYDRYVQAQLIATSRRLQIFVESSLMEDGNDVKQTCLSLAGLVCRHGEHDILDYVQSRVGAISDLDGDDRLTVLITTLTDGSVLSTTPITGCVRGSDFNADCGPFGGDIVYLDQTLNPERELRAVLAHELTHAAVFSLTATTSDSSSDSAVPRWLNEAIAHVVELEVAPNSPNLTQRFEQFRSDSTASPVVLAESFADNAARRGASRAAACSFLATTLALNDRFPLRNLVTRAGDAGDRFEACTGVEFSELFRAWTLALLRSDFPRPMPVENRRIELAGTSIGRFGPAATNCVVTVTCSSACRLQVTVVENEPQRSAVRIDNRSRRLK